MNIAETFRTMKEAEPSRPRKTAHVRVLRPCGFRALNDRLSTTHDVGEVVEVEFGIAEELCGYQAAEIVSVTDSGATYHADELAPRVDIPREPVPAEIKGDDTLVGLWQAEAEFAARRAEYARARSLWNGTINSKDPVLAAWEKLVKTKREALEDPELARRIGLAVVAASKPVVAMQLEELRLTIGMKRDARRLFWLRGFAALGVAADSALVDGLFECSALDRKYCISPGDTGPTRSDGRGNTYIDEGAPEIARRKLEIASRLERLRALRAELDRELEAAERVTAEAPAPTKPAPAKKAA
jgi:hypothetical protein